MDEYPHFFRVPVELIFAVFALFVSVNLVYLDILVFGQLTKAKESPSVTSIQPATAPSTYQECPQSCLAKIQEITASTSSKLTEANSKTIPAPTGVLSTGVKEFFVPFGSGSGSSMDWEDIPGLEATINTANYPKLKTVTFEATLRIPTGNQTTFARLYNKTDKHPVWFSDVSVEGGTGKLVISSPIVLDVGAKTYQVQLKNSLGYPSYVDQSRLKMITQ